MGTENVSTDPNSPNNPNNPYTRHTGLRGTMGRVAGGANAARIGENINDYLKKDKERLAGIEARQVAQAGLRTNFDTQQNAARAGGNLPVFNPGKQVFK